MLWHNDISAVEGSLKDFYIEQGLNNIYVEGIITINNGISALTILTSLLSKNFSNYYFDANMKFYFSNGAVQDIGLQKIPIKRGKSFFFNAF